MAEQPAGELAAAHLSAAYHGWSIRIPTEAVLGHRDIKLGAIRRCSHDDSDYVAVLDTDDATGSIRDTEHLLAADTLCLLVRKLASNRPRRGAYAASPS